MKGAIAVYQILKGDAPTLAAVNGIYPQLAKEGTACPYITIHPDNTIPHHTKSGGSTIDVEDINVQINSTDQRVCKDISDLVRSALDGYSGTITTADETINVTRVWFTGLVAYVETETNRDVYVQEMSFNVRERRTADY